MNSQYLTGVYTVGPPKRESFAVKRKWKIVITVVAILVAVAGVYASTVYSKRGIVTVQTGPLNFSPIRASRTLSTSKELAFSAACFQR